VDILCSFLTIPLGTIARLVEKDSNMGPVTVGCLNSLYHGVTDLDEGCMWNQTIKPMLLQPINSAEDYCNTLKLNIDDSQPTKYFICNNYNNGCNYNDLTISTYKDKHYCRCRYPFTVAVIFKHFRQGFVNSVATFVITDDLTVMPNSIDYTSFSLLQELGIKNPCSVKEIVLKVTKEKVLYLNISSYNSSSNTSLKFLIDYNYHYLHRYLIC